MPSSLCNYEKHSPFDDERVRRRSRIDPPASGVSWRHALWKLEYLFPMGAQEAPVLLTSLTFSLDQGWSARRTF